MISPDDIQRAADEVARIAQEQGADMVAALARVMATLDLESADAMAIAQAIAERMPELERIAEGATADMQEAAREAIADALESSEADDAARAGAESGETWKRHAYDATRSAMDAIARSNLMMPAAAAAAFISASTNAAMLAQTGKVTHSQAMRDAVRKLAADGIRQISYRKGASGLEQVNVSPEAAVRRVIITEIGKHAQEVTNGYIDGNDPLALVEVSSHYGARPDHAEWQGRVYGFNGSVTMPDGTTYPGLRKSTGYGTAGGLCGVNCRHHFAPYRHGEPRMYDEEPESGCGYTSDEAYRLTQRQRLLERRIREAKRELIAADENLKADDSPANLAEVNRARALVRQRQREVRDLLDAANKPGRDPVLRRQYDREWVGDLPRSDGRRASGRTLDQLLDMATIDRVRKANGLTKAELRRHAMDVIKADGMSAIDFARIGKSAQRAIVSRAIDKAAAAAHSNENAPIVARLKEAGVGSGHAAMIAKVINESKHYDAKRVTLSALDRLRFDSTNSRAVPHYNTKTKGITINLRESSMGFKARSDKAPYQTLFHEIGHMIDRDANAWRSSSYGLGDVARSEFGAKVRSIMGERGVSMGVAYDIIADDYKSIDKAIRGGVTDIADGATCGEMIIRGLSGHGEAYWKNSGALDTETFAHFYECAMSNPEALETLVRYFPESYRAFNDMLKGM